MRRCTSLAALLALLPVVSGAQAPAYRARIDTTYMSLTNPYRMYWVRGTDTVGQRITERSVEAQTWAFSGDRLSVVVRNQSLDVGRTVKTDTLAVNPAGRVLMLNGSPPAKHGRIDFLLRLPAFALERGTSWADTLDSSWSASDGDHAYRVERQYTVTGTIDSATRHLTRVSATGRVHYRDGWWSDSSRGTRTWLDVSGPVMEHYLFDVQAGQLVRRQWEMDLRGRGSLPNDNGSQDTLPAGLVSSEVQTLVDGSLARFAMRALPIGDTSWTVTPQGRILLHTVRRIVDTVESALARNDGLVGVATTTFNHGIVVRYVAQWTQGVDSATNRTAERRGDSLYVRGGGADTVMVIPAADWGIADYAMQESLVPVILRMIADGVDRPFAVYRPYARHWDVGTAMIRETAAGVVSFIRVGKDAKPEVLLITRGGDYIYGSNSGPTEAERVPLPKSARRAQLETLLAALKAK